MAGRRHLSPEERAAWEAVARTVKPLRPRVAKSVPVVKDDIASFAAAIDTPKRVKGRVPPMRIEQAAPTVARPRPTPVLDGTWEKRIRAGRLDPDISVDLHGLTLAAAHVRLDRLLGDARTMGWRVLHVVTGKPRPMPGPGEARKRGAIRAEIGDWLAHSPHARHIASVRQAHPRHGGDGAIYIILRRGEG